MLPGDVILEITSTNEKIIEWNDKLKLALENKSKKEYTYRQALAKEIRRLKYEEKLQASLIPDVARGNSNIAQLRYAKDVAENECVAIKYHINSLSKILEAYRSILSFDKTEFKSY